MIDAGTMQDGRLAMNAIPSTVSEGKKNGRTTTMTASYSGGNWLLPPNPCAYIANPQREERLLAYEANVQG
jgi:hypothetical protein